MAEPLSHWIVVPVALPLLAGAVLVLAERRGSPLVPHLSLLAVLAQLGVAIRLALQAAGGRVEAYLLSNWPAPFGIALALDRLAALMLLLTAVIALAALLYARGFEERRSAHFHALFQFQLMGLNGAFLTADLFNLFVFFEVLLIASYGLVLHGAGSARLRASVHYVTFNLAGSTLFLVAVAMLFGLTGTLNMADLAQRVAALPAEDAVLVQSAALLLLVVFCVKAAAFPLYFWLPDTYGAATAPVAALFAIMTKVGVYSVARVYTLVFGADAGVAALVAYPWLPLFALATLALATVGALAATRMRTLIAYVVIASAGTLLLAIGLGTPASVAAALFYLVNSTLIAAGLFLLVDAVALARGPVRDSLRPGGLAHGWSGYAPLYLAFAMAAAGLPPLAGFLGKSFVLEAARTTPLAVATWTVVLVSGLGVIIALARAGSTLFWAGQGAPEPAPVAVQPQRGAGPPWQRAALAWLLAAIVANAVFADALARFAQGAAAQLIDRRAYVEAVLGTPAVPPLFDLRSRWGK